MAFTSYGGTSGRKFTVIVSPAARMGEVATSRCPLTATASAPASHKALTTSWRSTSWTDSDSRSSSVFTSRSVSDRRTSRPGPAMAVVPAHIWTSRSRRASSPEVAGSRRRAVTTSSRSRTSCLPRFSTSPCRAWMSFTRPARRDSAPRLASLTPLEATRVRKPTMARTAASGARTGFTGPSPSRARPSLVGLHHERRPDAADVLLGQRPRPAVAAPLGPDVRQRLLGGGQHEGPAVGEQHLYAVHQHKFLVLGLFHGR